MPPPSPDDQLVDAWLGSDLVPADVLLAYKPGDTGAAERYCLALYHQMEMEGRAAPDMDTLWASSARFDPERRLLKAVHDLSLLDVCYEALRHAAVFGRWVQPRPRLAAKIAESRCLQAFYAESGRRAQATTFTTPSQYLKDSVRNLLLFAFLFVTMRPPDGVFQAVLRKPTSAGVFVDVALVAAGVCVLVWALRLLLRLPRSPTLLVIDQYSAGVLRSNKFLLRSVVADLLDEILYRWLGVITLGFLLSLIDLALMNYIGSLVMVSALYGVITERCSIRAILIVGGLAAWMIYAQLYNFSLLWNLGHALRYGLAAISSRLSFESIEAVLEHRQDLLTAIVMSPIRLPSALTLKPWRFSDVFLAPFQLVISAMFWSIALSDGLLAALIARFTFSVVAGALTFVLQGPISFEFIAAPDQEKSHRE